MKKTFCAVLFLTLLAGYYWISYSRLSPEVRQKKRMLDKALQAQGYKTHYFLLSGFRPPWLNRLMPLAAKNSVHQQGKAIDLFIVDVDGNWLTIDRDLSIVSRTLDRMDKANSAYLGGVGLYHHSFSRMLHFDVSGRYRHWDY